MKITIDGRLLEIAGAPTILEAARTLGISIPTLCEHRRLLPYAACRICLVDVAGRRAPVPACATPIEEGMAVTTNSPKILDLRRQVLSLILAEHPAACLVCVEKENCEDAKASSRKTAQPTGCILCPADGRCELQKVVAEVGLKSLVHPMTYRGSGPRRDDPFIDRDDGLCILCGRCVRVCHEIRGADAIAFINRGSRSVVGTSMDKRLLDVGCRFCGACVDVCPTGALTARSSRYGSKFDVSRTFVCGLCGQGCRLGLRLSGGRPVDIRPEDGVPNDGQACVKGRFIIGDLLDPARRLTRPMVRRAGELVETTWEEALAAAGRGLAGHQGRIGVVFSAEESCEDLWAMGRLARVLGAAGTSISGEPSVYTLGRKAETPGSEIWAPPVTAGDLGKARLIFVFEEALPLTAPIYGVAVNQALLKGGKLVAVGDGEYCHDRCASVRIKAGPAEAGRFLAAVLRMIMDKNHTRGREAAAGYETLHRQMRGLPPDSRADAAAWKLDRIAGLLDKKRPTAFIFGPQFVAGPWGPRNAAALWNLAGWTGGLYVPVGREANIRGAVEIAAGLDKTPTSPGPHEALLVTGAVSGFKRAGEEFVVVAEAFRSEAVAQADVVLPRTIFAEQDGTFVNAGGRLQFSAAAVAPAGEARPLRAIAADLAGAAGRPIESLETRESAWADLAAAVPSLAEAERAARENRPALIKSDGFEGRGFVEIPDLTAVFPPSAAFPLRDPDDYLGFAAAVEIKSLKTARRR